MIGEQLSLRNIEVIQDFSTNLPKVLGDANQLEQVFLNLLANGRDAIESKYESRGGGSDLQKKIVIAAHVSGDAKEAVEILFKDTGGEITEETLHNIISSIIFSPPKRWGKGRGWDFPSAMGSFKTTRVKSMCPKPGRKVRRFGSDCRFSNKG